MKPDPELSEVVEVVDPNLNPDPKVVSVDEVGAVEPNLNPEPVTAPDPKLGAGLKKRKIQS